MWYRSRVAFQFSGSAALIVYALCMAMGFTSQYNTAIVLLCALLVLNICTLTKNNP
jgi:hypothetical protein